jgi:hypothetical protein
MTTSLTVCDVIAYDMLACSFPKMLDRSNSSAVALDQRVRLAAFEFLREQQAVRIDEVLPRSVLAAGFQFERQRVPLIGPQGIFKPAILPEIPHDNYRSDCRRWGKAI